MTRNDYQGWQMAKPQMQVGHDDGGKKSRYRYGKLTVDSKNTKIEGLESKEEKLLKAAKSVALKREFCRQPKQ